MILYHFTSARHFAKIQGKGISLGVIPWKMMEEGPTLVRNWQWLTQNAEFEQEWDLPRNSKVPFRRTEYRIAIDIPNFACHRVCKWQLFCQRHSPESAAFLNSLGDTQNWFLFRGVIPAAWFLETTRNPTLADLSHLNEQN